MNNKTVEAIILAGGRGQRMGELTNDKQKCLLTIEGEPILGIIVHNLISAFGSVDAKIAISYHADDVKTFIDKRFGGDRNISFSYIPHEFGAGTLGAYRTMIDQVGGIFIGLPGDVIAPAKVYAEVLEKHNTNNDVLTLTVTERKDFADSHGVILGKDGNIEKLLWPIAEDQIPNESYRDVNIYVGELQIMNILKDYPKLTGAFTEFIQAFLTIAKPKPRYYLASENVSHFAYPVDLELPLAI